MSVPVTATTSTLNSPAAIPPLLNGCTALGPPFSIPGYWKDGNGHVHLKGVVQVPAGRYGQSIFQLGAGYIPTERGLFQATDATFGVIPPPSAALAGPSQAKWVAAEETLTAGAFSPITLNSVSYGAGFIGGIYIPPQARYYLVTAAVEATSPTALTTPGSRSFGASRSFVQSITANLGHPAISGGFITASGHLNYSTASISGHTVVLDGLSLTLDAPSVDASKIQPVYSNFSAPTATPTISVTYPPTANEEFLYASIWLSGQEISRGSLASWGGTGDLRSVVHGVVAAGTTDYIQLRVLLGPNSGWTLQAAGMSITPVITEEELYLYSVIATVPRIDVDTSGNVIYLGDSTFPRTISLDSIAFLGQA